MSDLKAWRAANGKISQAQLAAELKTTQPHLSAIENGEENISLELSARIFARTKICVGKLKGASPDQASAVMSLTERADA